MTIAKTMKTNKIVGFRRWLELPAVILAGLVVLGHCPTALAFPPAPYHLVYGLVRDRYGAPLTSAQVQIVLITPSGSACATSILPGFAPGINYQLKIPMDAGQTMDLWQPNALLATSTFKMVVVIAGVTNIPIEMTGGFATIGQPGQSSRVDLTLGVVANGDGLPDAWEYAFMALIGTNVPLSSLNANSVLTPDGRTLRQQYVLGTYPFDPGDTLNITFIGIYYNSPVLRFPTVAGRSYTVQSSSDLKNWSAVPFNLPGDTLGVSYRSYYYAPSVAPVQVYVAPPASSKAQFYRVLVQ
jgi:hypothetical protein